MPQLTKQLSNEQGSVLVGAFAFAIVMAIAGSGLLMLAGHGANLEDEQWRQECAFQAFESGLQIGKRWLADTAVFNHLAAGNTLSSLSLALNGATDTVKIEVDKVISRATTPGLGDVVLDTCIVVRQSEAWPGIFINNFDVFPRTILNDIIFDGNFHSNSALPLSSNVEFRNGPVTVYDRTMNNSYGTEPSGNNYDFGISGTAAIDGYFQNTYTHSQDFLFVPTVGATNILLPLNDQSQGDAILYFDVSNGIGRATYYYHRAGDPTLTSEAHLIDDSIIRAQNDLYILGTVLGNTTVVTNPGLDIYPIGKLVYFGFDSLAASQHDDYTNIGNYGIGNSNTNHLSLVSGRNIIFKSPLYFGFNRITRQYIQPTQSNIIDYIYITASFFANEPGCGVRWIVNSNSWIDNYNYRLRCIGGISVDRFFNYAYYYQYANHNAPTKIGFFFDTRLQNPGLTTPGFSGFKRVTAAGNELFLLTSHWRQQNIPGN